MCPACLTTLLLTAGGTGTATGLLAWAMQSLTSRPKPTNATQPEPNSEGAPTR